MAPIDPRDQSFVLQERRAMSPDVIEEMINRAARRGAKEALESIGLHDENAGDDMRELRNLLDAWRSTKKTVWSQVVKAFTMATLGAIAAGAFLQIKGLR
jgi:2-iminoacetate synthase ThiH